MQGAPVRQLTQREARVWNFLNAQDDFFPIRSWPAWLQDIALSEHRNNRDRYNYFFFLVANGLQPTLAGEWTLMNNVEKTGHGGMVAVSQGYNDHARRQVTQMIQQLGAGCFFTGKKKMMDLASGKVITQ